MKMTIKMPRVGDTVDSVSAIDALAAANGGTTDARAVHHLVRLGAGLDPILINPPTP